jgi:hypothetical protein
MSAPVAAMMLQCFFNPATGTAADGVPTIKVLLSAEYAQSLAMLDPPQNRTAFVGENGPLKEWVIGNSPEPSAPQMKLLRIRLMDKVLPPSPYEARLGMATKQADNNYAFAVELTGYCNLKPVVAPSGISQ